MHMVGWNRITAGKVMRSGIDTRKLKLESLSESEQTAQPSSHPEGKSNSSVIAAARLSRLNFSSLFQRVI